MDPFKRHRRWLGPLYLLSEGFPFEKLDAGHYIPSTKLSTRYDEDNINAQCHSCNRFKHGNLIEYRINLVKKIGEGGIELLEAKRNDTVKRPRDWYEEKIAYYKGLISE